MSPRITAAHGPVDALALARGLSAETEKALAAAGLDPVAVADVVVRALTEDLPAAGGLGVDATSVATVPADLVATGRIVSRARGVVAGLPVAAAVFEAVAGPGVEVVLTAADGDRVGPGGEVLRARGPVRALLTAERTALNLLCHLSGVATATRIWVDTVAGTPAAVRDTRKTLPGLRALEKYAVRAGGGVNHRMSLVDAALIKDNHVVAAGGVAAAFAAVRRAFPDLPVEVECDTVAQVEEAVRAGADLILCDNMTTDELRAAVALARPAGVRLEASGGLTLEVAAEVAATGVDYLAVGALTHSVDALDLGLDLTLDAPASAG
ncbi:carboxylating nicotinate-nucleotide diphosphorylase [Frankia sp. CNm7]|uniref:Nicotinate-nucleotide pyrophosphorylase [carboxylating] n=1 Tax=Frankia nepalensis TaxID=1836974 RepID=A0A937RPH4_9ACTN|nr:carboxylating nicotinate-nucleotide diphosphorylase [Frankia nepalensis]MBL7501366.1 carboxylating nicotinate-nucleotide diphosphorylase [Frankia nepalensis]MBL7509847.1 carboxylating nicotinate-nucleotide diphosphorylase [Frankia nepalensis]MBL7524347.1 carboxylating nicotinate-nucleotide diphosphorylase [Frankia nepalensis]MBL7629606.1 carboxylating nicotinate-nucleotide diphosphorylase [Frankia nepalensis]